MVQKSLEEKVKLLTKVNEEKNDDASLTVRQLVALVGISKRTLQDWQKNDANLREQREETMLRGRGLKTERKRLRTCVLCVLIYSYSCGFYAISANYCSIAQVEEVNFGTLLGIYHVGLSDLKQE
ncbi:unnamed protein product [Clavelina lepadiformis]|uniref:HTH psq-type domain-containing protein n=1 Tax=Clavelina lepadiformis TaxID=159417 RepID=A0ABP0GJW7_CLALP